MGNQNQHQLGSAVAMVTTYLVLAGGKKLKKKKSQFL